mgnify:CR=1 FL=1
MFYFIAWSDERRHRSGRMAEVLRGGSRRRPRQQFPPHPHPGQQLPAGSRGDEARQPHRHRRHSEPGHRDVGDDGADRRSLAGAPRRQRRRHRAIPPHHDRGRKKLRDGGAAIGTSPRAFRTSSSNRSRASFRRRPSGPRSASPTRSFALKQRRQQRTADLREPAKWAGPVIVAH